MSSVKKPDIEEAFMREFRCTKCRYKLAEEYVVIGRLRIKCPQAGCGQLNTIIVSRKQ